MCLAVGIRKVIVQCKKKENIKIRGHFNDTLNWWNERRT